MSGVRVTIKNPPGGEIVTLGIGHLQRTGWEVVQRAEEGSGGRSTVVMDDLDESLWDTLGLNVGGRQKIQLIDLDSDRVVHSGFVGQRRISRRFDDSGTPVGRAWEVDIWDVNSILQRRILTHKGAKRGRESDRDRIEALFDLPEWGIIDTFLIGPSETTMSKHDYRGMTVGQYINDCAQMARKNWWCDVVYIDGSDQQTFWYGRDTRNEYASTLAISNDLADLDVDAINAGTATVYPPAPKTTYSMDPERVFDGIWATGEKQSIYRRRPATADVFGLRWDTSQQWPTVHEHDRLVAKAESMLDRLKDEHEIIETSVEIPSSQAHLIRAGMSIPIKLTHVPTLAGFTDCRILSRGLAPIADGSKYRMPLTLEPIGPGDPPPEILSCSVAVSELIGVEVADQAYAAHTTTITIIPEAGEDSIILANAMASNKNIPPDTDMTDTSAATEMFSENVSPGQPAANMVYLASDGSGPETITASYTPGFNAAVRSHWAAVAIAIKTSATAPVQFKAETDAVFATVSLDAPPTPGNLLVLQVSMRAEGSISGEVPGSSFWTTRVQAIASSPGGTGPNVTGILTHCVETGDDEGPYGVGSAAVVCVSEWVIS